MERVNLILEATKMATQDIGVIIDDNNLRILTILATSDKPVRRADLASWAGLNAKDGSFQYRLRSLAEKGLIRGQRQNGKTYLTLTNEGRYKARGIIGLLRFVVKEKLNDPEYRPYRDKILRLNSCIDTIYEKLEKEGLVATNGQGRIIQIVNSQRSQHIGERM
jgi:repressor of nif and glnA expression